MVPATSLWSRAALRGHLPHPCCGTGGFLAQAYEHMERQATTAADIELLKDRTFYGREKESLVFPIALANLMLHGIDAPHVWHGNSLTGVAFHAALYTDAPALFEVVLTNPPFGGKESKDAQSNFAYKTSATQLLFLQHVIDALADGGICGAANGSSAGWPPARIYQRGRWVQVYV